MNKLHKVLNILGVIFALWFGLTSWLWTYNSALFISYPFGILGLLILLLSPLGYGKKMIKILLLIGIIVSMIAFFLYR
jgi:hypothetical protein